MYPHFKSAQMLYRSADIDSTPIAQLLLKMKIFNAYLEAYLSFALGFVWLHKSRNRHPTAQRRSPACQSDNQSQPIVQDVMQGQAWGTVLTLLGIYGAVGLGVWMNDKPHKKPYVSPYFQLTQSGSSSVQSIDYAWVTS